MQGSPGWQFFHSWTMPWSLDIPNKMCYCIAAPAPKELPPVSATYAILTTLTRKWPPSLQYMMEGHDGKSWCQTIGLVSNGLEIFWSQTRGECTLQWYIPGAISISYAYLFHSYVARQVLQTLSQALCPPGCTNQCHDTDTHSADSLVMWYSYMTMESRLTNQRLSTCIASK